MMENKLESPDYQMDISEAGTTCDNISTSSVSPTISSQANESESRSVATVTDNMNSIQLKISSTIDNRNILTLDTNLQQQQQHFAQKLTPVHHHPLMIDYEGDSKESNNKANIGNFPDVVLAHHQPLSITGQPAAKNLTADLVNSVNNNNNATKIRKPIYQREPSPVSLIAVSIKF